jgi:antibiotic biosynthesis monooxygenase (ABM) superfamily enzyme
MNVQPFNMDSEPSVEEPITVCTSRVARPGREAEFERVLHAFVQRSLEAPGQLGVHVMRPAPGTGSREYGIVRKFASRATAHAFYESRDYRMYNEALRGITEGDCHIEEFTGLESWITPSGAELRPLPRWKMGLATLAGVYPTSVLVGETVGRVIRGWPMLLRALVFATVIVALLTWVVMPLITRVLHPWLHPDSQIVSKGLRR